jgi:hypothetical protein
MQTWEIFVLVIFIILLLLGLILGIYFVWRYENDKNKPVPGPTGPNPPGPSGASGATGISGNFSISPVINPNTFMSFTPEDSSGGEPLNVITSSVSNLSCANYSWQNIANFIGPQNSVIKVPLALVSNASTGIGGYIKPINLSNPISNITGQAILTNATSESPSIILSWVYNPIAKTWCGLEDIYNEYCLYYNGSQNSSNDPVTVEEIGDAGVTLQAANFQWNNISPITAPKCIT